MYDKLNMESESRIISDMKDTPKVFFGYAKARQKTSAKVGPFLDQSTGELNLNASFTANCLSN